MTLERRGLGCSIALNVFLGSCGAVALVENHRLNQEAHDQVKVSSGLEASLQQTSETAQTATDDLMHCTALARKQLRLAQVKIHDYEEAFALCDEGNKLRQDRIDLLEQSRAAHEATIAAQGWTISELQESNELCFRVSGGWTHETNACEERLPSLDLDPLWDQQ